MAIWALEVRSKGFQDIYNVEDNPIFSGHDNSKIRRKRKQKNRRWQLSCGTYNYRGGDFPLIT